MQRVLNHYRFNLGEVYVCSCYVKYYINKNSFGIYHNLSLLSQIMYEAFTLCLLSVYDVL